MQRWPRVPDNHMSKIHNPDALNQTERAVLELVSTEQTLSNAEIAETVGTRIAFVRDIRRKHESEWTDMGPQTGGVAETGDTTSAETATTATQELIKKHGSKSDGTQVLDSLHDAIVKVEFVQDRPVVRSVNQAFVETFGYTAGEIVGESLREYIVPEDYAASRSPPAEQTDAELRAGRAVTRRAHDCVREFLLQEIPHEAGGDQYVFKIFTDISQQKRQEVELQREVQQLTAETRQLEHEREKLEQFASVLSHDLRNPISIAEGYLAQIKTEDNEENVEVIERALSRMNALIDDTLTLKEQTEPVEDVTHRSIAGLAESAWEFVDTGDSELRVVDRFELLCHEDRTSRLLENVFRNAIDHNEQPVVIRVGIHDTLTTSTRGDTKKAFFISDDGCGIPEDKREQMFEVGETTSREGTGLGLPIIKRIAEAHGWNVQAVESFDGGAKFVFTNVDIS